MISRRPNSRKSSEHDPGPRNTTATATTTTRVAGKGAALKRFGVDNGSHENAMPNAAAATRAPAIGVNNPIESEIPLADKSVPSNQISAVWRP